MATCLKRERNIVDTVEVFLLATMEYNKTTHFVTKEKPVDVLITPTLWPTIKLKLAKAQGDILQRTSRTRRNRIFNVGDQVMVRICRRRGNKLSIRYEARKIQADLGTTVLIRGRMVHKDNIK